MPDVFRSATTGMVRVSQGIVDQQKRLAGQHAATLVEDGLRVGLGSGTTAREFVRALGERVVGGLRVRGVASSFRTAQLAREVGIPLDDHDGPLDLAVDGADAVERETLAAIKGLGGSLTREKLVAQAANRFILICDESKLHRRLADSQPEIPIPVEVLPFGWKLTLMRLSVLGNPILRELEENPFVTDNGNFILDLYGSDLEDAVHLASRIKACSGVVDHGLFLNMATEAIIAGPEGIQTLTLSAS